MESSGGWQFWLEDNGCVRQFMVAEPDEIKARGRLRKEHPKGNILSRKIVPENVIQILKMKAGDANGSSAFRATLPLLERRLNVQFLKMRDAAPLNLVCANFLGIWSTTRH